MCHFYLYQPKVSLEREQAYDRSLQCKHLQNIFKANSVAGNHILHARTDPVPNIIQKGSVLQIQEVVVLTQNYNSSQESCSLDCGCEYKLLAGNLR